MLSNKDVKIIPSEQKQTEIPLFLHLTPPPPKTFPYIREHHRSLSGHRAIPISVACSVLKCSHLPLCSIIKPSVIEAFAVSSQLSDNGLLFYCTLVAGDYR